MFGGTAVCAIHGYICLNYMMHSTLIFIFVYIQMLGSSGVEQEADN